MVTNSHSLQLLQSSQLQCKILFKYFVNWSVVEWRDTYRSSSLVLSASSLSGSSCLLDNVREISVLASWLRNTLSSSATFSPVIHHHRHELCSWRHMESSFWGNSMYVFFDSVLCRFGRCAVLRQAVLEFRLSLKSSSGTQSVCQYIYKCIHGKKKKKKVRWFKVRSKTD